MNRPIPNGAWCNWRANPGVTRQGKVVRAEQSEIDDPKVGRRYTVKLYESDKVAHDEGGWRHAVVGLKPDSYNPAFEKPLLQGLQEGELRIIAELAEVLP